MAADRGRRAVLGVTLIVCGSALLFLAVHRQAELASLLSPLPAVGSAAARMLSFRAARDIETWCETAGGAILLAIAGTFLVGRTKRPRREANAGESARVAELEALVARARAEEARAKARLSEIESSAEAARALLFDLRARADREIDAPNEQNETLRSELATPLGAKRENGGPPLAVVAPLVVPAPMVVPSPLATAAPRATAVAPPATAVAPPATAVAPPELVTLVEPVSPLGQAPLDRVATPVVGSASDFTVSRESTPPARRSSFPELRRELRFVAQVEVDFESESHFYTGLSENLSEGGLFIATYDLRPVGTVMDVVLKLPGHGEPIRTRGTVRWIREFSESSDAAPGMGLNLALDDAAIPRVRRFLSTRPPLFFDDE